MGLNTVVRTYLVVLSGYHVLTGIVSMFFPDFALVFYRHLYGCRPAETKLLKLTLKPWGALALFAGVVGLFAASDPVRYEAVLGGLWLLLAYRAFYRLAYEKALCEEAGVPPCRNKISVAMILVGVAVLGSWFVVRWT